MYIASFEKTSKKNPKVFQKSFYFYYVNFLYLTFLSAKNKAAKTTSHTNDEEDERKKRWVLKTGLGYGEKSNLSHG